MIPYGRQDITPEDVDAVAAVLRSDFLTQGPVVPRFEQAVAAACNTPHAVAVNSATSALHLACLALDIGPGDWLWTTPITFVATANCARYCGAMVDFVDIDAETFNLSPIALGDRLVKARRDGRLPKAVAPVHLAGQPADMEAIGELGREFGFRVIEDASHAIGGRYHGAPIGAGTWSDITVFSFHPVKIITTGEGGMALTRDAGLARRMERLRSHGITRDPADMTHAPDGPWYYQQVELGYNYRMTELQAALGLSQLERLETYVARRHALAARYDRLLAHLPLTVPFQAPGGYSAFHLYIVRLDPGIDRLAVFNALRAAGIGANLHYIPVHTQPYYRALGFAEGDFPVAEDYYRRAITLPLHPGLTEAEQDFIVETLAGALRP